MPKLNGPLGSPPRRSNCFFKVFLPNLSSKHLKIPPAFQQHFEGEAPTRSYLKGPSDCIWGVDLVKNSDGLFFADGWEAFVLDHSLSAGDFLLFKFDGNSTFSVMVFDNTACEKKCAFFARPTCDEKIAFSFDSRMEEEERKNIFVVSNQSMKRKTPVSESYACGEVLTPRMWSMQRDAGQAMISGGLIPFAKSASDLLGKSFECSKDLALMLPDIQRKDDSKKNVLRGFLSQRRPTTQEERNHALARAQSFNSDKPFFMMVMKGSYVYHGFYLALPGSFPFKHLPSYTGKMYLHDPDNRRWTVNYLYSRRPALSGGWGKFAVGNNLEADDVVVFELIARSHMNVHIFRVVDDYKPLMRSSLFKKMALTGSL